MGKDLLWDGLLFIGKRLCNISAFDNCSLASLSSPSMFSSILQIMCRAARNGHLNVVEYLVTSCKVNIDACTSDGTTAFCWASWQGHLDIMK